LEIALLGSDEGLKKGTGLISGITLFRITVLVGIGLIFTGLLAKMSTFLSGISTAIGSTLSQLHLYVTSGQHVLFDVLLIASGVILLVQAVHHWRNRTQTKDGKENDTIGIKLRKDTSQKLKSSGACFSFLYSASGKGWENETQRGQ